MSEIRLPLWFISERQRPIVPGASMLAFSKTARATAYLCARPSGELRIQLIADAETLLALVADLHELGEEHVLMDVSPHGAGGIRVSIAQLASLASQPTTSAVRA